LNKNKLKKALKVVITMNKNVQRIHFYTKKIAQLGSVHPTKRDERWYNRAARLVCYKKAMHDSF
jgi:hypothetical protein